MVLCSWTDVRKDVSSGDSDPSPRETFSVATEVCNPENKPNICTVSVSSIFGSFALRCRTALQRSLMSRIMSSTRPGAEAVSQSSSDRGLLQFLAVTDP